MRLTLNYFCHLNEAFGFLISEAARRSVITLNDIVIELRRCTHSMTYVVDMTHCITYSVEVTCWQLSLHMACPFESIIHFLPQAPLLSLPFPSISLLVATYIRYHYLFTLLLNCLPSSWVTKVQQVYSRGFLSLKEYISVKCVSL